MAAAGAPDTERRAVKRIPDLRAGQGQTSPGGGRADTLLLAFFALMLGLILLVCVAPGLSRGPGPDGYWQQQEGEGYPAIVQRLVDEGVLVLRTLPRRPGEPPRRRIEVDEAAARALVLTDALGSCDRKAKVRFQKATTLCRDTARADPMIWRLTQDELLGMRVDAHRLLESGYRRQFRDYGVSYAGAASAPSAAWVLVEQGARTPDAPSDATRVVCGSPMLGVARATCFDQLVMVRGEDAGLLMRNGRRGAAGRPLALRSGDVIRLAAAPRAPSYQLLPSPQALSVVAPDGRRVRDPRLATVLEQIDTGLFEQVRGTIRRDLQALAQARLEATLEPSTANEPVGTLRGAILLMDGMTGEIAAAASYPARQSHLSARDRAQLTRLDWVRQNQNFELLLPGSAAKVPFAAAIVGAYPNLAGTKTQNGIHCIRWHQFMRDGTARPWSADCPRGGKYVDSGPSPVDLEMFIQRSNNFYAFSLLRQAWLTDSSPEARWQTALAELACTRELPGAGCPVYPWRFTGQGTGGRPLPGLRLTFDAQAVKAKPAAALLYSITGLGEFKWTTVQLAQAYARLLNGRSVSPRLTATSTPTQSEATPLDLGENWVRFFAGMRGVIAETGGTAHRQWKLGDLAPGVILVGKTGTPTLVIGGKTQNGKVFVLAAIRTKTGAAPTRPDDICGLRIAVVNIQYFRPTGVEVLADLIGPPAAPGRPASPVRTWMTAECSGETR